MTNPMNEARREFEEAAKDRLAPASIVQVTRLLERHWFPFLGERAVRRDQVTMDDFREWEGRQRVTDVSRTHMNHRISLLVTYFRLLANAHPNVKAYRAMAVDLKVYVRPKTRETASSWKPYPLAAIPRILEAARSYDSVAGNQYGARSDDGTASERFPSEDDVLTALFAYTGIRSASGYGLRVKEIDLDARLVATRVKGGHEVYVPIHKALVDVLGDHLASRPYRSAMLFRWGRDAFAYADPRATVDPRRGSRDLYANEHNVQKAMGRVEAAYARLFGREAVDRDLVYRNRTGRRVGLVGHRFRVSVGTYAEQYGLLESERRLLLSHGAKSITSFYSKPDIVGILAKWDRIDLGSAAWVAAHDPPTNLFAGGNGNGDAGLVEDLRRQLADERTRNDRLERKLDEILARTKVVA